MQDDFKKLLLIVITSAFSLSVLSCAARDHNGNWEGKTSQEKTLSFTVQNNTITNAKLEYALKCERGGFCPTEGSFAGDIGQEINGDSFSAKLASATLSGKFDSDKTSSGELKVEENNPYCGKCSASVTWTAKKQ
jgi:hypothetical protein